MKVFKITVCEDAAPYICDKIDDVVETIGSELRESDIGNIAKIETVEMTKEAFEDLPEWTGP
jgi:hypothetical protein